MPKRPTRRDLIAILFKHRHLFLLLLLGSMAGGGIAVLLTPKRFAAHAELALPVASRADPAAAMAVQAALLRSPATQRAAVAALGIARLFPDLNGAPDALARAAARLNAGLDIASVAGGRVLSISLALQSGDQACAALASLLDAGLAAATALEARAGGGTPPGYLLLAPPDPPIRREPVHKLPIMAASLAAGLLLALAGVAATERFDDRFTTPWQMANALSLPVLASFPRRGEAADLSRRNRQV